MMPMPLLAANLIELADLSTQPEVQRRLRVLAEVMGGTLSQPLDEMVNCAECDKLLGASRSNMPKEGRLVVRGTAIAARKAVADPWRFYCTECATDVLG